MATAVSLKTQKPATEEELAARYAGDLVYRALIEAGDPLKASEVVKALDRPDIDLKLARVVLTTDPRMTAVDRKWTLWSRYIDVRNTLDRNIHRILQAYGQPIHLAHLAQELHSVYGRPSEIYEEILSQITRAGVRLRLLADDFLLPVEWLLDTESVEDKIRSVSGYNDRDMLNLDLVDSEILFENFIADDDVMPFIEAARQAGLSSDNPASMTAFLNAVMVPVKNKAIQFLAYHLNRDSFDAYTFFHHLYFDSGAFALSSGAWIGPKLAQQLTSHFATLAEQEVSENAETEAQEAAKPLEIGLEQREELVQAVLGSDETVFASDLLDEVFGITVDDRTYQEDLQTLIYVLNEDERVLWVGAERFRPQGTIPGYVFTVPGLLDIPEDTYVDLEGNLVDQLLEDDGFDGGLEREIVSPLAQDVLDEEPVPMADPNPPSNARAVVKYHHKQIGTLPLCQFPSGFFPPTPTILETEFVLPGSQKAQVWVNNETRLLYGLLDWFQAIPIDSGATFTLERQSPDRFVVNYNDESEPTMFISRNRINELLALQERAETEQMPTFDILREIMEHYRKGIEFITLLTEINVVRRVTRRMVASILSEYHCFFQRGGAWVFDAKKLPQGFDKSKRKYLVK